MDEARFGTHSKIGHGWFPTGERSVVKVKLGFKNSYIYGAIEPKSGEFFSLLMPKANSDNMNIFLQEMSKHYRDEQITLIMDGAGWHKAKSLIIPSNIKIIHLPPYSPELNPVERMWRYIKSYTIRNKIYDSLESLENSVCDFIGQITNDLVRELCAVDWYN
jgi:transposase